MTTTDRAVSPPKCIRCHRNLEPAFYLDHEPDDKQYVPWIWKCRRCNRLYTYFTRRKCDGYVIMTSDELQVAVHCDKYFGHDGPHSSRMAYPPVGGIEEKTDAPLPLAYIEWE